MLFANSEVFGTFKGFNESGLEFAAEIVSPYDASMLDRPQLGQFLLIELGSQEEAALVCCCINSFTMNQEAVCCGHDVDQSRCTAGARG